MNGGIIRSRISSRQKTVTTSKAGPVNSNNSSTDLSKSYGNHITELRRNYESSLTHVNSEDGAIGIEGVLIHSGSEGHYFGDDRIIPFQAYGHFLHWLPVNRPDQFVYIAPTQQVIYFQVVPQDFWYEQTIRTDSSWPEQFQIIRLTSPGELGKHLPNTRIAYLGAETEFASSIGIDTELINPDALLAYLDFQRAIKTDYELEQLREANRVGLLGHAAARESFLLGGSEYDIHMAFLNACGILEEQSPYTNIVALDEKSAILHYQHKRRGCAQTSQVLLIDAGCRINGYGSDITRTSIKETANIVFKSLLTGMEKLELELVSQIKPGMAYQDLHDDALAGVADLLIEHDLCKQSPAALIDKKIPQLFMPHGVGHLLGIQVHDVGGQQKELAGGSAPPAEHSPALRNTRIMEQNMVFTVEPGFYFIPLLLEAERDQARGKFINWKLIDELYPCGGIRVEDNVRVTDQGVENLSRQ